VANPTTNYGFVLPQSTDLVTDLPADFDVALQGVDTQLKALQPGTTLGDLAYSSATANTNTRLGIGTSGQVLAVSGGGVPAWTTTSDVTPLTTKGDLFTFTTVDARIGIGANNTVLTADSAEATGMKWATPTATTPPFVGCVVRGTTQQSIATATQTKITFNTDVIDTNNFHDTATNAERFTVPAGYAGKYRITYNSRFASNATGTRNFEVYINGSNVNGFSVDGNAADDADGYGATFCISMVRDLIVSDYVELQVYQSAGVSLDFIRSYNGSFSFEFLGA
jgi:hypothetical protein